MADVKILLVEDESIEAMDIQRTLESFGYNVPYVASKGEEAVSKALEIRPDIILMDIILKGEMDGIETANEIKALNIPIIYLTAHSEEPTIERAKLTGPYGYIIKPYEANELKYAIELALYKNKMEKGLKASEEKYHSILDNIQDAYFRGDKEGNITMASPSAARMYKFNSPEEMIGISAISLYKSQEDRNIMLEYLKKHGKVLNMEGEALRNDGTSFWASMNVQFIYDENGQIQGTEAFVRDISKTKKAENKIKESENYYKTIFEHTGTANVIIEEDTTISLANAKFEKLSGYSRREIEGKKSWTDFVVGDDLEKMEDYHRLRRINHSSAPIIYDFRFIDRKGDIKNIHLEVEMIPNTKKSVAALLDITEHKNALEEIQKLYKMESEIRADAEAAKKEIYTVLERVSDSFVALDNNWNYTYVNKRGAEHFGKTPEEMIGQHIWTMFPEGIDQPFYKAYHRAMEEQKFIHLEEYYEPYDRWFENDIYPSEDGITIFFKDITEEKKAEEILKESEEKYRQLFETMTQGVIYHDADGIITSMNPAAENIMGYTADEIPDETSKSNGWSYMHEDGTDFPGETHPSMVALKTGKPVKNVIIGVKSPNKKEHSWLKIDAISQFRSGEKKPYQVYTLLEDISQRKKAENALSISENKYRTLFDNAGDGILLMKDNLFVECNEKALEVYGATRDQIIGQSPYKFSPEFQPGGERSEDKALEFINKALDGHSQNFEWKHLRYNGTPFYAEITLNQLQIENEYLLQAIVRDITERKEAEYLLKESAERFRAVAESAVDAIATTDAKGNIMFFNNSLTTIFGYTKKEIIGKPLTILMPERFRKNYLNELGKFEKSGEHRLIGRTVATTGLKKDGNEFPFEMSLASWKSRGKTYFTSIIRDITERKLAEEALHESEEKYKTLFESGPAYTILLGLDGIILDFNASAEQIIGISKDEVVGKHFSELKIFPEEDLSLHEKKFPQIFKHEVVDNYESQIIDKNGEIRWGDTSLTIIRKNNVPAYVLVIFNDITERKQAENEILQSLHEKELLLREIHHRVKNNMQIISSLLNLQMEFEHMDETLRVLKESQGRVKSMAMVHEKLYQSPMFNNINFKEYVEKLVYDILYSYGVKSGSIEPVLNIDDINLNIDTAIPLGLIVNELVTNSVKYAFPQGEGTIRVKLKSFQGKMELVISDNGLGLPEEFDLEKTETLGLQLVKSLTDQIDGEIELDRSHGTKFKVKFKELKYKERV